MIVPARYATVRSMTPIPIAELRKPGDFLREHRRELPLKTYSALRYHLDRRHENGLIECGAVIESPLGVLIWPTGFANWILGKHHGRGDAA